MKSGWKSAPTNPVSVQETGLNLNLEIATAKKGEASQQYVCCLKYLWANKVYKS